MEFGIDKSMLLNASFGYAYYRIIYDKQDVPFDYEFLEVNFAFEKLTGLKGSEIIGKTVCEVFPNILDPKFDFLLHYKSVALNEGENEFEYFFEPIDKCCKVQVSSPQKGYLVSILTDIGFQYKLASFAQTLLTYTVDTINYQNIVDTACDIAGATYAVFNVFEENGKEFTSVAFSGMTPEVQSATSMLGVHFPGQKWPYDALRKVGNKKTNIFHTINQLTDLYLPKEIVDHFALQFKVNQLVEVKIEKQGRMLGYLTFIFTNGQQLKSQSIIETYADMTGMLLDRLNQEFETKREYAKFKQITSQITDIVWRTDLQFNNTYISESVERILGLGVEEYKNVPIDKRYPQGVLQDFEQIFKEELEKESQPDVDKNRTRIIEIKHYKADNSILPMEVHLSFIRDAEGVPVGIQGVSRDILERKQAEVKVKESIQCMDVSMEMANMAWWKMELPSGKVDFSPRKAQMLGYSPERFNHYTDFTSIIHPDDYHHTMSIMHMYIVGLIDKYEVEYRILTKSGEYKWFLDIGSIIEKDTVSNKMIIRGVVLDVTERKLSEEKLRESETNFRSFFETMSDLIIIANAKGDIFYANPSVSRMLGYSSEELNKMNVLDVHPFENRTQAEVVFNEIFEEKRNSCPYPMVKKDGMIFPVETRIWFGKWDGKDCAFGLSKDLSKEQEALQKFTALFENNPSLMAVTTISDGKFVEVNSTFLKVLGYTKEEVIDKSSSDLSLFIEPLQHQEVIVALFNHSKVEDIELQVRTKEGRVLTGLFSGTIIENQGVKYFLSVMVDITERKALEEDIKHQNQFRKLLMEIASDFINIPLEKVDLAIQNALEDLGGFVYADRAYTFDYDWEQNVCDNTYEWCAEGITPEIENLQHLPLSIMMEWVETHKKGEPFFVPNVSKLPSGVGKETLEKQGIKSFVTVPMMNDNHCVGFVGFDSVIEHHEYSSTEVQLLQVFAQVMANVKMRKEMFGELEMEMKKTEESETKLKESQTLAKLGGWEFDVHKGVFKFNDNFYAMFHTNANEMDGYELTPDEYAERFLFADDCQLVAEEMEKAMTTNNPDFSSYLEHRIRYFDGGIGYLAVKYYVVKDENGDTIKTYGVNQDITEKKLLELDLIAAKDKAEESNRLKTAFINNISHEIRTPLNGILGISGVMIDEAIPMSEKLEFHHNLEQSTNRLLQTITDIIDISELNAGTISPQKVEVQTAIIIRNQIEKFRERCIYKQIELKDQIPVGYEHLTVYTSQELLTKILFQILSNAEKFTSEGSIIVGFDVVDQWVRFFVKDTGKGIAADKLEAVFEPFIQEDVSNTRGYEGSGLGLSLAKGMVELLGGKIWLETKKGFGSTFYFQIPNESSKSGTLLTNDPNKSKRNTVSDKPLVLIAEDDDLNFIYMKELLTRINCDYLHAHNGLEAIDLCKEFPNICLVLMDVKMPMMNGIEATRHIRGFRAELPIIATTAYAQIGDEQYFIESGCNDYIAKPIKKDDLVLLLNKYLNWLKI